MFGAEVVTFRRLVRELAGAAGVPGAPLGRGRARARGRAPRCADARLRVLAASARRAGLRRRGGRAVRRAPAHAASTPGALHARAAHVGGGRHRAARTPRSSRRCTRPTTGGWSGWARATRRGCARAALDALRERPGAWGARPVLPVRLRRPDAAAARRGRDAVGRAGADVCVVAALRGRAGPRSPGRAATVELLKPLADATHVALPDRSEHYAPRRRAARCTTWSGGCSSPGARAVLAQRRRAAARGGRRARGGRARRRRGARADARGRRAGGHRGARPRRRARGAAARRTGWPTTACPSRRDARVPLRRTRLGAGVLAFARAALPGGTAADVLTLAAHARQARRPGRRRRAGGARCAAARPPTAEPTAARGWRDRATSRRSTRSPRRRPTGRGVPRRRCWPRRRRSGPRPHARRGGRARRPRTPPTRGPPARCAPRRGELRALAAADPELLRRRRAERARGAGRVRGARAGRRRAACWWPTRWRSARGASAPCSCAGCRTASSRAARSPSRSSTTTTRAALARASGLVLRRHEDVLGERAPPLLRVRLAPGGGAVPLLPQLRRGGRPGAAVAVRRRRARAVHRRAVGRSAARGCWPRSRGRRPRRRRRTSCAGRAPRPSASPEPRAARRAGDAPRCAPRSAARGAEPARGLETFAACGVRWLVESVLQAGAASSPTPSRCAAARSPTPCSSGRCARLRERDGLGAAGAGDAARPRWRSCAARWRELRGSRGRGGAARPAPALRALEVDLGATCATRPRRGAGLEPRVARVELRRRARRARRARRSTAAGSRSPAAWTASTSTPPAAPWCATTRADACHAGARWAAGRPLQAALYALAARELLGLDVAGALYQPIGRSDRRPRGLRRAGHRPGAT